MKIQVNRQYFIEIDNIEKIEEFPCYTVVHQKQGYPKYLKAKCTKSTLLVRMVNAGLCSDKVREIRDR